MRIRARVGLLGAFAAAGLGAALCIGTAIHPAVDTVPVAPNAVASWSTTGPSAPATPSDRRADAAFDGPARREPTAPIRLEGPKPPHPTHPLRLASADDYRPSEPGGSATPLAGSAPASWGATSPWSKAHRNEFSGPGLSGRFLAARTEAEDPDALVRSFEEYRGLRRPLERTATRSYAPRHLAAAELRPLVEALLDEGLGEARLAPRIHVGGGASGGPNHAAPVLAVRSALETLDQLDLIVPLLDVPQPFVTLDAVVLSVRFGDSSPAGIDFARLHEQQILFPAWRSHGTKGIAPWGFSLNGLKFAYLEGGLGRLVEALAPVGATDVLAAPRVAVLNGHSAELLAPPERLQIRPLVSGDGTIRLEIWADEQPGPVRATASPERGSAARRAVAMARDGTTMVFGGWLREKQSPAAAAPARRDRLVLFPSKPAWAPVTVDRREILAVVAVKVVWDGPDPRAVPMERLSLDFRRSVAGRFARAAERAEAAGDLATAFRLTDHALRFDPELKMAIDLRNRLWTTRPTEIRIVGPTPIAEPVAQRSAASGSLR